MSAPITLTALREVVEPIMNENFDGLYDQRRDEWKTIFNSFEGEKRSSHVETVLYGFGNAPITGDGEPLSYDTGGTQWSINFPYDQVALGFGISLMAMEDSEHIDLAQKFSKHLAQSIYETEELLAANILNYGFNNSYTQLGGDGKPLFSATHALANGNTFSNVTTPAALSMTSLEDMLIQISLATDAKGKRIRLNPKKLVTSPHLRFQNQVVLNSILNPDTPSSNQINPISTMKALEGGDQIITRLTSPSAWFVATDLNSASDRGLVHINRRKLTRSTQEDFQTSTVQYKASMRYRFGWIDPRGMYGNLGQ